MTELREIAETLVAANRAGETEALLDSLYDDDAVSVEAADMGQGREVRGLDAIRAKHAGWNAAMEMTGGTVSAPMYHGGDRFAVVFEASGRERASGNSFEMTEVAVYHVKRGKIVREEFFYDTAAPAN